MKSLLPQTRVSGSFHLLFLYDTCEEILLDDVRELVGAQAAGREPSFRHPAPQYVRFQKPPVVQPLEPFCLKSTEQLNGRIKYYDYGVISVEYELRFTLTWQELIVSSSRWLGEQDVERHAAAAMRTHLSRIMSAVVKKYADQLSEEYYLIQLDTMFQQSGSPLTAAELFESHGSDIALLVRGESTPLSKDEESEILQSRISYYVSDLVVVGWTAAFVYDTPDGAAPTLQLLEYANSQLLEFRHYDDLLTKVLTEVYRSLDKGTGFLSRWRLAREALRLNTIRLDVRELTERVDNAIKFLSDMFSARLYRLAAAKVGVPDYRTLVDEKLATAGELYQFMMDEFYQGRAFVLEVMVVIILIIELIYLFRGRS